MTLLDLLRKRRSIRRYKPDPIPNDKLEYVLEAGRLAPSWRNLQCWRYIIVTDEEKRREISTREWAAEAPIILVGCAHPEQSGTNAEQRYYMLDMGIFMEQMILAAAEQGLGTCWVGAMSGTEVHKILSLPEDWFVHDLLPLGYPDQDPAARPRKTMEKIAFWEKA